MPFVSQWDVKDPATGFESVLPSWEAEVLTIRPCGSHPVKALNRSTIYIAPLPYPGALPGGAGWAANTTHYDCCYYDRMQERNPFGQHARQILLLLFLILFLIIITITIIIIIIIIVVVVVVFK